MERACDEAAFVCVSFSRPHRNVPHFTRVRRAMPDKDDPLAALRARAYALADTGHYSDWASLSAALVEGGSPDVIVRQLTHDALFQIMLKDRMTGVRGV